MQTRSVSLRVSEELNDLNQNWRKEFQQLQLRLKILVSLFNDMHNGTWLVVFVCACVIEY